LITDDIPPKVKLLFDYTKFHIGLYATLISALIAVTKLGRETLPPQVICALKFTVICFVFAGAAGGVIASTISVDYERIKLNQDIGPFACGWCKYETWAHIEHYSFWLGIIVSVVALLQSR